MTQPNQQPGPLAIQDLYRPPAADVPDVEASPLAGAVPFYVVSRTKFVLLFAATFGSYAFYWHYENWRRFRYHFKEEVSPFWRTVFSIFFTHRLFNLMTDQANEHPAAPGWSPELMATLYVVLVIMARVASRAATAAELQTLDLVSFACSMGAGYPLYAAQAAANVAGGDPAGSSNSRLTAVNYGFLLLGGLCWLCVVIALLA